MHNRDAFVAGMALEFLAMAKAELAKKFQIPTSALSFNLQEEDVSRALEASLMENQFGPKGARGMMIDYVDPLNPHERKRCGMVSL